MFFNIIFLHLPSFIEEGIEVRNLRVFLYRGQKVLQPSIQLCFQTFLKSMEWFSMWNSMKLKCEQKTRVVWGNCSVQQSCFCTNLRVQVLILSCRMENVFTLHSYQTYCFIIIFVWKLPWDNGIYVCGPVNYSILEHTVYILINFLGFLNKQTDIYSNKIWSRSTKQTHCQNTVGNLL